MVEWKDTEMLVMEWIVTCLDLNSLLDRNRARLLEIIAEFLDVDV